MKLNIKTIEQVTFERYARDLVKRLAYYTEEDREKVLEIVSNMYWKALEPRKQ